MKRAVILLLVLLLLPFDAFCEADDFLADSERYESTKALFNSIRYAELEEIVNEYIQGGSPRPSDSVFSIKAILDEAAEAINAIDEAVDDFDGSRSFTLDGVHGISEEYCVAPGYDAARWLYVELGFIADDWVFFDEFAISIDGDVVCDYYVDDDEIVTDVLHGGAVLEKTSLAIDNISLDDAKRMVDSNKVVIRFSNEKTEKKYDHVLADEEKAALFHGLQLLRVRTNLSNLYWNYSKENEDKG